MKKEDYIITPEMTDRFFKSIFKNDTPEARRLYYFIGDLTTFLRQNFWDMEDEDTKYFVERCCLIQEYFYEQLGDNVTTDEDSLKFECVGEKGFEHFCEIWKRKKEKGLIKEPFPRINMGIGRFDS